MISCKVAIFDLDGTIVDNNKVHYESWMIYLNTLGMQISDSDYKAHISGRTNHDAVEHIFNKKMSKEEAEKYYLEKEEIYRELYAPIIRPVNGLLNLLEELKSNDITMAIATSGIQVNIDFMFKHIPIRQYFDAVINSTHIKKGKPDPEIFLTTAKVLKENPAQCVVFEDSIAGVQAALAAKMKVVAITTTHSKEELQSADCIVNDFTRINNQLIQKLFV